MSWGCSSCPSESVCCLSSPEGPLALGAFDGTRFWLWSLAKKSSRDFFLGWYDGMFIEDAERRNTQCVRTHRHTHIFFLSATSKDPLCFAAHFSYLFLLLRDLRISSLLVAFLFCRSKGRLELVQTALTVLATLSFGSVQFLVAKHVFCRIGRSVL